MRETLKSGKPKGARLTATEVASMLHGEGWQMIGGHAWQEEEAGEWWGAWWGADALAAQTPAAAAAATCGACGALPRWGWDEDYCHTCGAWGAQVKVRS